MNTTRQQPCGKEWVCKTVILLSSLVVMVMLAYHPIEAAAASVTLKFETQALDLDTGVVAISTDAGGLSSGSDVYVAYHADRVVHAVIVPLSAEIVFLPNTRMDSVTSADAIALPFSQELPDQPFAAADTVVIRTAGGTMFKLGNAAETTDSVTFSYEQLP